MTTINYRSKVGGALLVLSLLFGIAIMSSMTAQAQDSKIVITTNGIGATAIEVIIRIRTEIGDAIGMASRIGT